jgi:hypothetical protein
MKDPRQRPWPLIAIVLTALAQLACRATTSGALAESCTRSFLRYEPSAWEKEWSQGELSGERRDRECEILATPTEVQRSVQLIRSVQGAMLRGMPIPQDAVPLFSRMVYSVQCGGTSRESVDLIEPLVGILRDPFSMCPRPPAVPDDVYDTFGVGEDRVQSKRHFLTLAATGQGKPERGPHSQNILIDIGASTFASWQNDPAAVGAMWFVDRYRRVGWTFDWIVSYEIEKLDPDVLYRSVPADVLPHYVYFNQGVEKDPGGKWNPWRILKGSSVTPDDYVVVKLDIDAPDIEHDLVAQVMADPALQKLIDEMFYEHHVNTKPMWPWWGTQNAKAILADSYRNFTRLRAVGIRMHSWP